METRSRNKIGVDIHYFYLLKSQFMNEDKNLEVLTTIVAALKDLDKEAQRRTIQAVTTFLDIQWVAQPSEAKASDVPNKVRSEVYFAENRDMSPKEFLRD